jgi:hypothetical protein
MDCRVKPGKDERWARCGWGRLLQVMWEILKAIRRICLPRAESGSRSRTHKKAPAYSQKIAGPRLTGLVSLASLFMVRSREAPF